MPFPIYDTQDAVPEAFRPEYEEREGKWHPKLPVVPDVAKLNTAIETERTNAATEKAARIKAEEELTKLRRKHQAADNNISEEALQKLRDEDAEKRRLEMDPLRTELETTKKELVKVKKTDRVQQMWLDAGGMAERREDAMLALEKRTGLTEDGNTITVLDKDGKLTTEKIEDFLSTSFRTEKPWLYAGNGGSGSGALPSIDREIPTEAPPIVKRKRGEHAYGGI